MGVRWITWLSHGCTRKCCLERKVVICVYLYVYLVDATNLVPSALSTYRKSQIAICSAAAAGCCAALATRDAIPYGSTPKDDRSFCLIASPHSYIHDNV